MELSEATISTQTKLKRLGVCTNFDLLLHLPLRYEDRTKLSKLSELRINEEVLVEGEISYCELTYRPRRNLLVQLVGEGGGITLRLMHFYPSQQKQLIAGQRVRAFGVVRQGYYGIEIIQPRITIARLGDPTEATLAAVYPVVSGISTNAIARLVRNTLTTQDIADVVPLTILERVRLPGLMESLQMIHQPPANAPLQLLESRSHSAWQRVKFDELLAQQLSMRSNYRKKMQRRAPALTGGAQVSESFKETLPYALTTAQKQAVFEISKDMSRDSPMQRLLQGDVGSGKTIVAVFAALQAIESGYQVAIMAPTEILAEQHYRKISELLTPLGMSLVWLSGGQTRQERAAAIGAINQGSAKVAIGTHALFQEHVTFHRLGLVIIDEQHKFGVQQRLALQGKGVVPHQLMMSATPIPRTLAMSYFADLDVTVVNELPPGRTPIITKLVSDARREEVIMRVKGACSHGQQAYWVCPLIEESAALQLQTAEETFFRLSKELPDVAVGLIHGRMKRSEKADVMQRFKDGEISLLVATTVIEVGVDVPNASLMVIENAERMGLAQLHQLRGRVGRGASQSTCILLFQQPLSDMARARLKVIYENTDGFEVARQDMILRGPGEILGAAQSGVPMLRFADLEQDAALLEAARESAEYMLDHHPEAVMIHLHRWLGNKQDYLYV